MSSILGIKLGSGTGIGEQSHPSYRLAGLVKTRDLEMDG